MVKCRGEHTGSPRKGRHAGLPLPHEIQKTQTALICRTCVNPCSISFLQLLIGLEAAIICEKQFAEGQPGHRAEKSDRQGTYEA